ncbi:MAG TPA: hypothetical protein DCL69_04305 [Firmicutes bacterium]|nr:hypothetical protein [Bacillota bacterium]HBL68637.1 hypothetical protein [Bacillota bacterium]
MNDKVKKDRRFFAGLCVGLCAALFIIACLGTGYVMLYGFRFSIDEEELALAIKEKTEIQAKQELPGLLQQFEDQIPVLVEDMIPAEVSLDLGQARIELPPEAIAAIKQELGQLTRDSVNLQLKKLDLDQYANSLANMAYDLVKTTLETEVRGRTFRIQANRWMSIPVTVLAK